MIEPASKALVIGYGNPLRGDDGAGAAIASTLARKPLDHVDVVVCHQLTPELTEPIAAVALVVFVDARLGETPGDIAVSRIRHDAGTQSTPLVHHVDPVTLVSLAATLFGHAPKAFLVTVTAGSFELNEGFSEPVALALPHAMETIRELIASELHGG